ncbi:PQQ-dependent dehydrogenase, methanol/ethanol family [Govanella unica]|uniref:PQQ-dependent dehydrogenase, methanol/ethanol family n=1 Tax=Govanella unica TaxID=2975056 RepID=A0A9X3TXP5_9PROT|nr:PQQ-dependent dehydrogenase, methanol/ethanol family [Govania unica]MDA5193663.1 PQQ-dependent dehydrogenase, methanol/ethanol family [Govania unica]
MPLSRSIFTTVIALALSLSAVAGAVEKTAGQVDAARVKTAAKDGANWLLYGRTSDEKRYSPLQTINRNTVGKLGLAWEFDDFVTRGRTTRGEQGTPIVVDGVMYFSSSWNAVYALDAKTGKTLWTYDPEIDGSWARVTCCGVTNRGVAVWKGKVYIGTLDGYLVAVDARTGKQVWRVDTFTDRSRNYAITGAPRVAGNNIVIGNGGAEMGVRGYVTAYDAETGKQSWRFYTVPGDPAKGDEHPELTTARKTWGANSRWDLGGGGTVWDSMTYDPALNLLYIGTGNGSPHPIWNRDPGHPKNDNLYLSSIVAVDATTGRMKWYYQTTPGDSWDYTATQNMILADLDIKGTRHKVIMQAPKNGFFYVLDRETGKLLSAEKFTTVTWADRIDMTTGRPVMTEQADYGQAAKVIWPSQAGGHNWQPMAYSDDTKLVYIPVLEAPMKFMRAVQPDYIRGTIVQGVDAQFPPYEADDKAQKGQPKPVFRSLLKAWDPVTQKLVWQSEEMSYWNGGVLTTGGGLVFQGRNDGSFVVYDAKTGKVLKTIKTGTGILAAPMTYQIDGEQYVAVMAGFGGALTVSYPPGSAAWDYENQSRLLVFKLGGTEVALPPKRVDSELEPLPENYVVKQDRVQRGLELYSTNCLRCHGFQGNVGGYPNLWNMPADVHASFKDIVLGGALSAAGMASFSDVLSEDDVEAIQDFLVEDAKKLRAVTKEGGKKEFRFH